MPRSSIFTIIPNHYICSSKLLMEIAKLSPLLKRSQIERNHSRSWQERLLRQFIFSVFPYPNQLKVLLAPLLLYQKLVIQKLMRNSGLLNLFLPMQIAAMESVLSQISTEAFTSSYAEVIPAQGLTRYRVTSIIVPIGGIAPNLINFSEVQRHEFYFSIWVFVFFATI